LDTYDGKERKRKMRYRVRYTKKSPHEKPSIRSQTISFPVIFDKEPSREEVVQKVKERGGGDFIEESIKFWPERL
jgi:hypothetical protein